MGHEIRVPSLRCVLTALGANLAPVVPVVSPSSSRQGLKKNQAICLGMKMGCGGVAARRLSAIVEKGGRWGGALV
jgi:hypothetical protein